MAERDFLTDVFNDCVERMRGGASIDDCLRRYPQYAADLRVMLFSAEAVRRAQAPAGEAAQAQMNARFRFEAALQQKGRQRGMPAFLRYAAAAVAVVFVGGAALAAVSQSALPGDALYGVKRAGEQALLALSGGLDDGRLNDRRVEEIRALLAAGRTEEVDFEGLLIARIGNDWLVGELPVSVSDDVQGAAGVQIRDHIRVSAFTTPNGDLIADSILLLERGLTPSPTPSSTIVPTSTATLSPTATVTASATASATATLTRTPTATPTPSRTPTVTPSVTASATATPTATRTPSSTPTLPANVCAPVAPAGWVTYFVQPGDTLSGLAASTSATLAQVLEPNCLTMTSVLLAGQRLFLPRLPAATVASPPPVQPTDDSGHSGSGSDGSGDDSGDDHSGSNSGSGSSGGGSGGSGSGDDNPG